MKWVVLEDISSVFEDSTAVHTNSLQRSQVDIWADDAASRFSYVN